MDYKLYSELVKQIKIGKQLPDAVYVHCTAFSALPNQLVNFVQLIGKALKIAPDGWNVAKFAKKEFKLSFLNYPEFFEDSYPALNTAITVDLKKLQHKVVSYKDSENPPILHRKELFIVPDHPKYNLFCEITKEGENAGLYENTRIIGFRNSWLNVIRKKGYALIEGRLIEAAQEDVADTPTFEEISVERHKTAIVRHELSAPMKLLAKYGYLDGEYSIFDYGCGRGDDINELQAHGLEASGYDPNFYPESEKIVSDIVNLGFVINVIEDRDERIEVLLDAWGYANKVLVVSVMLSNENYISQFTPYKDGVITSRKTFQKYYTQSEIRDFLEMVLEDNVVTLAPGIFAIFKNKELEQIHQQQRYQRAYQWQQKTSPQLPSDEDKLRLLLAQNKDLLESFWLRCLQLGRCPANDEFEGSDSIRSLIGSHKKVFRLAKDYYSTEEFKIAETMRKEDLLLYFAMSLFDKHKPYTQQSEQLKRDIKAFFGSFTTAKELATELLFEISDTKKISDECILANETLPASKLSYENDVLHSITFHKAYLDLLPLLLRVYVGAALKLYGDLEEIHLMKIHVNSGKVTLLGYENFESDPQPKLKERVKIKMAEQDIDFFDYCRGGELPILYDKALYMCSKT